MDILLNAKIKVVEQIIQNILSHIDSIFTKNWYASESDIKTEFYNLLSKLQTVSHSVQIIKDTQKSWIMPPDRAYCSTRFQSDERFKFTFDLDEK